MPRFAVSYIGFFDNVLTTKIVEAVDWRAATQVAYPEKLNITYFEDMEAEGLEAWKQEAFNMDCMFDVVEIL